MTWKDPEAPCVALVYSVQVEEKHKQLPRNWYSSMGKEQQKWRWRCKALSEGSEEWVLGVAAILTLTFESLIGFLAILRSDCGNLWGWCKAECFYLCVVFFPFDESPDVWNPPPFPVLLSNLILAFKMGSKKREEKGNWFVCFSHFLGNTLSFYSGVTAKETLLVIRSVRQWLCYTGYLGK